MKRFLYTLVSLVISVGLHAQQYAIYATPQGQVKPLPNGNPVIIPAQAGGATGQIQFNNAGVLGGFTLTGDGTLDVSTGIFSIAAQAITNAKLAFMPAGTFKGNNTLSSGPPVDLTAAQAKTALAIVPGDISGLGSMALQNAGSVAITGGTSSGLNLSGGSLSSAIISSGSSSGLSISGGSMTGTAISGGTIVGTGISSGTISGAAISGGTITGLGTPSLSSDAANKSYVDSVATGITQRQGVVIASTGNLTLSGEQTIDGVLTSVTRILVKNQTTSSQNGIYVTQSGAWSRASDSNTAAQLKVGYYYFVSSGSTQGATGWTIQTAPTVLGTDPVVFGQFSASTTYTNGAGLSLTGNVFANTGVTGIAGTSGEISASGPSGGVTLSLPSSLVFTGKSIAGGTYTAGAFNGTLGATTPSSVVATTGAYSGVITSTVSTGTAPFTVASTTQVANLNAATAGSATNSTNSTNTGITDDTTTNATVYPTWVTSNSGNLPQKVSSTKVTFNPSTGILNATGFNGTVGGTTPAAIAGTTLAASGQVTLTQNNFPLLIQPSAGTAAGAIQFTNTGGSYFAGVDNSTGAQFGGAAYAMGLLAPTGRLVEFSIGGTVVGQFTSTGLNGANIGATTPGAATFTTINSNSNANIITSKANFRLTEIDIRDYGATTGSSDNTTAINNAIAAAVTGQSVLIPEGVWNYQGTLTVSNKNGVTIRGVGMGSQLTKTLNFGSAGLDITGTSQNVTLFNLYMSTTAGSRLGGHLVQLNGNGNRISHCRFANSSEFTIFAGTSASNISTNVTVDNNEILGGLADGIHFGAVKNGLIANNLIRDTADDAIAVGGDVNSNATYFSDGVLIVGNKVLTGGSRGILLQECQNVTVASNYISGTVSSGIWISAYHSTTFFNTNISLKGNTLYNVTNSSGAGRAAILAAYCNGFTASGNYTYNTAGSTLSSIFLCDCSSVSVDGNEFWNTGVHGIVGYDSTTTGPSDIGPSGRTFSSTWNDWDLSHNYFNTTANAGGIALYVIAPSSGVTIQRVTATGNNVANWQGGTYIGYSHNNVAKYLLNTSLEGRSITPGSGNTSVTNTPNY